MSKRIDLTGKKFGRLKVLKKSRESWKVNKEIIWICRCDCGNLISIRGCHLRSGHTKSCGCLTKERLYKHGYSPRKGRSRLYNIWGGIKSRCNSLGNTAYKYYGGKGISVCKEWNNNYPTFRKWALNNGYKNGLVLDRINPDENYEPSNCQWITKTANAKKVVEDSFKKGFIFGYLSVFYTEANRK